MNKEVSMLSKILKIFKYILYRPFWIIQGFKRRNSNIWIFGAWNGFKYSDNSKALFNYCIQHHPEIDSYWITKDLKIYEKLRKLEMPVLMANSRLGKKIMLQAGVAIISSGLNDFNPLYLNGIKQIWLWHGMPLKKIGFDEKHNENKFIFLKKILKLLNPYLKWNPEFTISNSSFFIPYLRTAFGLPESKILNIGSPRCDMMFKKDIKHYINDIKEKNPNSKVLFYMPTFRTASYDSSKKFNPFDGFNFDIKLFNDCLERNNLYFLYKPHFFDSDQNIIKQTERFRLIDDNSYEDLYSFLSEVDILITDYSSVYFDFISLNKPVILTPFDLEDYKKYSRGHYFDYNSKMEGIKANNWDEFISILDKKSYYPISIDSIKLFAEYVDNNCSKRVYDAIIRII